MSEEKLNSVPARRRSRMAWISAFLVAIALLWFAHPLLLSWAMTRTLEEWASANHLAFSAEKVDARLDGPVFLRAVKFRSLPGSGLATALDIPHFEWRWSGLSSLFSDKEGFVRDLRVRGISGIWDVSAGGPTGGRVTGIFTQRWLPREISVEAPNLEVLGKNGKWMLRDFSLNLSESTAGQMEAGSFSLCLGGYSKSLGPVRARTAWKNGTLWLAGMELDRGITVENLSLDFLHTGGPSISLAAACFGGSLRSDLMFRASTGLLDMAAWASNIPLDRMAALIGVPGDIAGKLAEGRFTYRGHTDRPADAEASLRLMADGFQWNKRGWESLEVGSSLIHRRLVVTNFDLRQKENSVKFNGEISLAEGWSQIAQSPFLINFHADIRELGALAGLLGGPLDEAAGRMSAAGSVTGHPGELDGFLNIEASDVVFRSLPPSSLRMESVFRKNEIDVVVCDLYSRKDSASLRGTVGIAAPHQYAGELDARIADLAVYLAPFHAPGMERIYAGALDARWQGDGNFKSHSGAFDVKLHEFVSGATPTGLTGKFAGTYSPQNLYFSKLEIEDGPLKLDSRATIAGSGITWKDVELKSGATTLLDGAAFVPMDLFAVLGGRDWRAAIDPGREAYVRLVAHKDLSLRSLLQLTGQEVSLEGLVRGNIEAGGAPARLSATGGLFARDLRWKLPDAPPFSLALKFAAADGSASLNGVLEAKNFPPATLSARLPFGLVRTGSDDWRWMNPDGPIEALLDFPRIPLPVFRPLLPRLPRLAASISGKLAFSGTIGVLRTNGRVELKGGGFEPGFGIPAVEKTEGVFAFDGDRMRIERLKGALGGGTFQISGGIGLSNPSNPAWDLQLHGEKVLLMKGEKMRVGANVDATWRGDNSAGTVSGTVRFVDGRISKRPEITPQLLVAPGEPTESDFQPPLAPGTVPAPFASWTLDLKIENQTPFLIAGKISSGEILPKISLRGTLGQPVPVGRLTLKDVQAFLPATTMNIPGGHVDFLPDSPWTPLLDVRGTTRISGVDVQAYAFGPLNEKKLILRSEPPLSQGSLVRLLTGGIAAGDRAPADQGTLFPTISLAGKPDWWSAEAGGIMSLLPLHPIPSLPLWDRATLPRKFRLLDNLDLAPEREGANRSFNSATTYTWRFR